MPNFSDITSINLGNTFGGWYNKTNEIINRINSLDVASITGGDGILVSQHTAVGTTGGFTVEFSGNVTKNMTFNGNVNVIGTLTYGSLNADTTGTQVTVPHATGVTIGNVVYINSSGLVDKAIANDECTSEVIGIVTSITGGNATIATTGKVSGASLAQLLTGVTGATFIKGAVYFLSAGVSGAGSTAEPNVFNNVSKPVLLGITGDTALILPYRAFIANNGLSGISGSSSTTVGITDAVLSLNGISASINSSYIDQYSQVQIVKKTTGHLHAITDINQISDRVRVILSTSHNALFKQYTDSFSDTPAQGLPVVNGTIRTSKNVIKSGSTFYNLFGTFGGLTADINDVYKLHRLRIIPIKIKNGVQAIPFTLLRMYHRYGCTNYVKKYGVDDSPFLAKRVAGSAHIQMNMKNYLTKIFSTGALVDTNTVTPATELYTPIFKNSFIDDYGFTGDGITSGDSIGNLDETSPYAIVNGPNAHNAFYGQTTNSVGEFRTRERGCGLLNRPYGWNFNNVILDSATISNYIRCSIEGLEEDFGASGYTMDSSILGWNATFGAVPESIGIYFPSISNIIELGEPDVKTEIQVILELYKYNPLTGASGSIIHIPVHCVIDSTIFQISGTNTTLIQ